MLGVLYFFIFLISGFGISNILFSKHSIHIRIWSGIIIGLINLMWLTVPFAFYIGFNYTTHILAMILNIIIFIVVRHLFKGEEKAKYSIDDICFPLIYTVIPLFILILLLLGNHILYPGTNGSLSNGQSTYGDLPIHLGMITSLAQQGVFPPDYNIFPGKLLSYPFLVNLLSASLHLLGVSLRWSILLPSIFMVLALISGIFILTYEVVKNKWIAVLTTVLFFLNGGFGFVYFIDKVKNNTKNFTRIFTDWYQTPTNLNEYGIRWSNTICDMIIPQRTTLIGWTVVMFGIWLLYTAITKGERKYFIYTGLVAGLLPMIHTHSFLALFIISATWFVVYLFQEKKDYKKLIKNWAIYAIIAITLALPQIIYWTIKQTSGGGFLQIEIGWSAIEHDNWLWFWLKNIGPIFVFIIPAMFWLDKKLFSFYSGGIVIFLLANIIKFQPLNYDNNKLFYIWFLFTLIVVLSYLQFIYKKLESVKGRIYYLIIFLFLCTFSGLLTIGREYHSGGDFVVFSKDDVEISEFVKNNTPKDALFVTGEQHLNTISSLAGRNILSGSPMYLYFHGIDYQKREADIKTIYESPERFFELTKLYKIDYVYISPWERDKFKIDQNFFDEKVHLLTKNNDISIYAVSDKSYNMIKK